MGLTPRTFTTALRTVRGWLSLLRRHAPASAADLRPLATTRLHTVAGRGHVAWPVGPCPATLRRPLRVLRIVDAGHAPAVAGRMVISGTLADVCAELDRLVAQEAGG